MFHALSGRASQDASLSSRMGWGEATFDGKHLLLEGRYQASEVFDWHAAYSNVPAPRTATVSNADRTSRTMAGLLSGSVQPYRLVGARVDILLCAYVHSGF